MTKRNNVALSAHFKAVIAASFLSLTVAAAAAAFAIGFTGALNRGLSDPNSIAIVRLAALQRLDKAAGHDGFLKVYQAFLAAGDRTQQGELRRLADDADISLSLLDRASANERDRNTAASLRRLEAPFRRAALFAAGTTGVAAGLVPSAQLESDYSALTEAIAGAAEGVNIARIADLTQALVWAQATSVGTLSLLSIVLFALAWFLRERLMAPLEALRHSVTAAAGGAISDPLWGVGRKDEIGAIARAAERLRRTAAASHSARVLPRLTWSSSSAWPGARPGLNPIWPRPRWRRTMQGCASSMPGSERPRRVMRPSKPRSSQAAGSRAQPSAAKERWMLSRARRALSSTRLSPLWRGSPTRPRGWNVKQGSSGRSRRKTIIRRSKMSMPPVSWRRLPEAWRRWKISPASGPLWLQINTSRFALRFCGPSKD